ncbi:MAG: rcsC [Segetibacter sp.]|nr:rcsC [Segetibacter sp.]
MTDLLNAGEVIGEHNLTKLFAQAPAPIAIYKGRELRYVFLNDAYSRIFNYRDILGKTVKEAFPELEGQPYYGILQGVFDTGTPFYGNEIPALVDINNDGNLATRYYNLVYTPYRNDLGVIEGVMVFGHDVTDNVEARTKERESDLRFRSIVEQSVDPILILKGEDMVLDVANNALFSLWGVGKEALGKPFLEILPEMKDQEFMNLLLDVYRNGTTHNGYETPVNFVRANGDIETRYMNFIYQPYYEIDRRISGVLVLATDVSEQVLAKQRLNRSETNFRNMIIQAPVAMCVLKGADFIVEIANLPMYELWGKPEEQLLGKPIFEGLHEAKGQGLEQLLYNVYTTGTRFVANELAVQLPRNEGIETLYLNFVYEAFHDGDGAITGIIAVGTDVTEQVLSRQKVEVAEENVRLAVESADLGTYEINFLTNEAFTSDRFNAIWGFNHSTTSLSEYASIIHPDDLVIRERAHNESKKTGSLNYDARIIRKDGALRWIKVNGKMLYDRYGAPQRLLGVVQDITEQKLFAEELANKVEERTTALQEANQRLERSNEELEQFAYVTSHDLQEPLRKIQLFSSLILDQPDEKEHVKKYLEKVSASASRMAGLIRDLLDYSRLSQTNLQFQQTDLNAILENVLIDFEVLISQKKATFKKDHLPTIDAISLQMNQLLFNLIGNALKFTKRNTLPVITITAGKLTVDRKKEFRELHQHKEYYEIKVSDNGIGFNQEYADRIFTIFQTLNEKSSYGGYGIGLALCRKIVTTHAGVLYATGNTDGGATFTFILPCNQE